LRRLAGNEPHLGERIDVISIDAVGGRLYKAHIGRAQVASRDTVAEAMRNASAAEAGHRFTLHFLLTEWDHVVDAWRLADWEAYRDVARLGRMSARPSVALPSARCTWRRGSNSGPSSSWRATTK
jgi:hypothetical protein